MTFSLTRAEYGTFEVFRPRVAGRSRTEFVERIDAVSNFARANNTTKVLLDYRETMVPLREGFFESLVHCPHFRVRDMWRIAVVVGANLPPHNVELAQGFADLLVGLRQSSARFFDYAHATHWLTAADPQPA